MDEDVVGKTSRLSRRVNIRKTSLRALQRYLVAAYTAFAKAKLLGYKKGCVSWVHRDLVPCHWLLEQLGLVGDA